MDRYLIRYPGKEATLNELLAYWEYRFWLTPIEMIGVEITPSENIELAKLAFRQHLQQLHGIGLPRTWSFIEDQEFRVWYKQQLWYRKMTEYYIRSFN